MMAATGRPRAGSAASRLARVLAAIVVLGVSTIPWAGGGPASAAPPADFEKIEVLDGLSDPTAFRFAPNGDIYIAEQAGAIKILRGTQVITIGAVSTINDHEKGLLGIELDQGFATNHYLYASYTHSSGYARLSRFEVHDDVLDMATETIFYQSDQVASIYHNANDIHHGPDGKIWWSIGDNLVTGNSQSLQSIHGKIARFDVDGTSANDNPWHGDADKVDETYALGLRNPFRFTFLPNGKAIVGDVGGALWEEMNVVGSGSNYGWPLYEGNCGSCGYANPVFAYPHDGLNSAISALTVYDGSTFPSEYDGVLFYGDYARQTIRYVRFDESYGSVLSDHAFDDDAGTVVDMHVGPDGDLYYLSIFQGTLFKYSPAGGNRTPTAAAAADPIAGLAPLEVDFSSAGSSDPDGTPLTYAWDFGDGSTSADPNPTHTYTTNGTYEATLTVSDGEKSDTATVTVTVGNRLPTATIETPTVGTMYDAGDTISYSATATDPEDGALPASAYSWEVVFHHAEHVHPYLAPASGSTSGSFEIGRDASNEFNTWYRIILTVTDSGGLQHTTYRDVNPNLVNLTVQSNTPGGKFTIDGNLHSAPYVHEEVVGVDHGVSVSSPQTIGTGRYRFREWSDGGAQTHTYRVPPTDSTLTAELFEALPVPTPWQTADIGNPALAGTADYDSENQAFVLDGGGKDIWGANDQFRYAWRPLEGNGEIVARVTSQTPANPWTKSGIMIKQSATAGATYAMVSVTPANGVVMQYNFNGNAGPRPTFTFPLWLKLTRAGNVFTSSYSSDGATWTQLGQATVSMAADATAGLFVTSHTDSALSTTVFDNISVVEAGPGPNTPPVASAGSFSTLRDTPVATPLTATDAEADPLTYSVVTPPAHGTLSGTAPNLTYTAAAGYVGADSFTFKANDGEADSNTATVSLTVIPPGGPVPSPWSEADVGAVTPGPGSATYDDTTGTFTVSGGGYDIWGTHDDLHYVYQPLDGDGQITARITSQTNTHDSAKAGVMIKESTTALSPYSFLGVTPTKGYKFQWNFLNQSVSGGAYTFPDAWVRLTRVGDVITAYKSTDGTTWNQVTQKTVPMSTDATIGLFVTSHDSGEIGTATFDNVSVVETGPGPNTPPVASVASYSTPQDTPVGTPLTATDADGDPLTYSIVTPPAHGTLSGTAPNLTYTPAAGYVGSDTFSFEANDGEADSNTATVSLTVTPPAGALPPPWIDADVGAVTPEPGSASYDPASQTFTVSGGGYDVWSTHDDFHYVFQPLDGDGQITARVTSQTITHDSAKAGVMIKESTTPFSPYSFLGVTPTKGYKFQWNFLNQSVSGGAYTFPDSWVRLTRVGDVVTAYKSVDGTTWTQVAQKTVPMASTATIGLFVTSHDSGEIGTATFDNVSVVT